MSGKRSLETVEGASEPVVSEAKRTKGDPFELPQDWRFGMTDEEQRQYAGRYDAVLQQRLQQVRRQLRSVDASAYTQLLKFLFKDVAPLEAYKLAMELRGPVPELTSVCGSFNAQAFWKSYLSKWVDVPLVNAAIQRYGSGYGAFVGLTGPQQAQPFNPKKLGMAFQQLEDAGDARDLVGLPLFDPQYDYALVDIDTVNEARELNNLIEFDEDGGEFYISESDDTVEGEDPITHGVVQLLDDLSSGRVRIETLSGGEEVTESEEEGDVGITMPNISPQLAEQLRANLNLQEMAEVLFS